MLKYGANFAATTPDGETALALARKYKRPEVEKLLLTYMTPAHQFAALRQAGLPAEIITKIMDIAKKTS